MVRTIVSFGIMFILCATVVLVGITMLGAFNIPLNGTHIRERNHTQAEALLPAYRSGVCDAKWVGYNIVAGEVLVACKLTGTNPAQCLLIGYRVTENAGKMVLTKDAYNTTAYVDLCSRAYNRKGFLGWGDKDTWLVAPLDLKAAIVSAFGEP